MTIKMNTTILQCMKGYDIVATENGDLYYWLDDVPTILFNTGESVSPDEFHGYAFDEMHLEKVLDLCELGLYSTTAI